jgi:DNA mismatch repair protein MutL
MGSIHLLSDDVINKIAAGEVVDRPSSIVKELVENALDAGADEIVVELEEGGIKRVCVRDNGKGMDRQDAEMSLQRHATSKINRAEDLYSIHTKGFRGEALASISAVSHLQIRTRPRSGDVGTLIRCEGGEVKEVGDWSGDFGTEINITELFRNIPARAAFLKSSSSEYGSCLEVMQNLAMIGAGVSFVLIHNGKERLRTEKAGDRDARIMGEAELRRRAAVLFESDVLNQLLYAHKSSDLAELEILMSPPGVTRSTQKFISIFVNGRFIKDRGLKAGILRGYHSHLMHGQSPMVVLNLWVNPSLIDVNVHPAKTEIRMQYAPDIQSQVAISVREVLRAGAWGGTNQSTEDSNSRLVANSHSSFSTGAMHRSSLSSYAPVSSRFSPRNYDPAHPVEPVRSTEDMAEAQVQRWLENAAQQPDLIGSSRSDASLTHSDHPAIPWTELNYSGAAFDCFLFFETNERLLVVDQHAFHERILYEKLLSDRAQILRAQPLLVPEVIDLPASQVVQLMVRQKLLQDLGFDLSAVGDTMVEIKSIPSLLCKRNIQEIVGAIAELETNALNRPEEGLMHDMLSTIACHSAVRAGEQLTDDELKLLLKQAESVDFYHNCPHGRRVFKWWTQSQVAAWFDR